MIFKECLTDRDQNQNIIPLINNNKNGLKEKSQHIFNRNERKYISRNLTIDINYTDNNRYILKDNLNKRKNEIIENEKEAQNKVQTITNSRIKTNDNIFEKVNNHFITQVELGNIGDKKDCIYLLEYFLKSNNYIYNIENTYEKDKIIFIFADEKAALNFAKIIYNEKSKNSLFKNVLVSLKLLPNKIYLKNQKINKKRGISLESIVKLYNGSTSIKKNKKLPKIKGIIQFGIKSPFYNSNDNKSNIINNNFKVLNDKNKISRNDNIKNIYGYIGYNGLPLKSYEKSKISVLDTHYNPFPKLKLREINKNKWIR